MTHPTRREFTKAGAAGVLTALSARRVLGANGRIRLGFIGLGNRGDQVLDAFLPHKDAEIVALCDLYQPYLDFAAKKVGGSPKITKNYHDVLAMKDVDAVVICTPDHWHALQTIHACQAGKDVYVEKPLSLCVEEGPAMVEAARKAQARHAGRFDAAVVGVLPRRLRVRPQGRHRPCHRRPRLPHPERVAQGHRQPAQRSGRRRIGAGTSGCGPAAKVPYNKNRAFYRFRWFYDYSGGQLTNFGVHYLDLIHWALGQDAPLAVTAIGGKYAIDDNREDPGHAGSVVAVSRQHAGDVFAVQLQRRPGRALRGDAVEFRGTKGTVYIQGNGWEVVPDATRPTRSSRRTPMDRALERGYRARGQAGDRGPQGEGARTTRPTTPAISSTASSRGSRATATSRSATAKPRPP